MTGFQLCRLKIKTDLATNFDAYWKKNVKEANNEGVVGMVGSSYKVKRKYTLDAAIIGIDTSAKYWQDQRILSTVIIAVSRRLLRPIRGFSESRKLSNERRRESRLVPQGIR